MPKWLSGLLDSNEKELKRFQPTVQRINELEPEFERLSNDELRAKTAEFKRSYQAGVTLDELLPVAFAAVREAAKRTLGQRHFDVQLVGGVVLHQGKIAEMKTGEGKTLVATLPLYLNSLTGQGCHLITVNDYLCKWQSRWMGPVYHALGVSVACIQHDESFVYDLEYEAEDKTWNYLRPMSRREAYAADITYGTNNEFGFDYLRDNMVVDLSRCAQRHLHYAIVDEVDNILIDEARTPLIISGPAEEAEQKYQVFARLVPRLRQDEDFTIDEKRRSISLTDNGITNVERALTSDGILQSPNLYDPSNASLTRYLDNALKAQFLFRRDVDYVVRDGEVVIVDEFTGRLMPGRRYSGGLHQSIEAKERVQVKRESMTYATITFQNYFRMYEKLAGMTGTAITEAEEFHKIYKLEVVVIPTNEPMIREDCSDQIYKDEETKFKAVVREVEQLHQEKRPILIGTVSIEKSEDLSDRFRRKGISHQVLNAKQHEKEAGIIAQAGRIGAVTVATNMAGRGVDIVLGGNPEGRSQEEWRQEHEEVLKLGGLHIIGTERHEARRIDNQLRGRAGRQGDPGSSRFYVSLEDDIMKRFGGDRIKGIMEWAGMDEDTPIENRLVNRSIEGAQVRVEGYNFDIRKHLVEYDDVINQQREIIYGERLKILSGADLKANILSMVADEVRGIVATHAGSERDEESTGNLLAEVSTIFSLLPELNADALVQMKTGQMEDTLIEQAETLYEQREQELGADNMRMLERLLMLRIIDSLWVEHLTEMDHMRRGIGLQSVAQRDPLVAYKREGAAQFDALMDTIHHDVVHSVYHANMTKQPVKKRVPAAMAKMVAGRGDDGPKQPQKAKVAGKKVGRNDPCPCGSGKKYKYCCGK
ncbi:MAG: preprotein translocase subunit SecA [Dehalococcoidales bacterium]|nr:MAG: preprotein translocase subunit SecA [Dehalococcoidales bacterium]